MIVVGRRRVGVVDDLLVLELAEELGERAERQAQLVGDPPARGRAQVEQELEDQALDLGMVQPRLLETCSRRWDGRPVDDGDVLDVEKRRQHRGGGKVHVA